MRLARKSRPFGAIDLPAFSDLAFLLIIFFVLTTAFISRVGTETSIPSATSDPEDQPEKEYPAVSLTADAIYLNEDPITMDVLRSKLVDMALAEKEEDDRIIVLESAPDVDFDRYFKVVSAISQAGGVLALVEKPAAGGGQ